MITISGRIASGSTSLAKHLADALGWRHVEGGEIFWEAVRSKLGLDSKDTNKRPDVEDKDFDESLKKILKEQKHIVLETKLAGFNAQEIKGVFKILVVCEDKKGKDQTGIRIDRFVNREGVHIATAKEEVIEREQNDLNKWRRMYAKGDPNWLYYNPKYYDLVINTFDHDQEEAFEIALKAIKLHH
ncbi:hypothetical protein KKG52_03715 [Patescibacteria group bacterium]|nr:hypothetical protein [Patescibacteria group bacterium]